MPKAEQKSKKVKVGSGRPSKYKKEYDEQARKLCLLGYIDTQLADFFGVAEATIHNWKIEHPSFLESLKAGKCVADASVVDSLYSRAMGSTHKEDKIFNNNGEALIVPTTKHYPPDTTACIFWLKNRQPELWREKVEAEVNLDMAKVLSEIAEKLPE